MTKTPSGSGERLIHMIRLIASGPAKFSLGEFAERAGLPVSSVHRLLKVLERTGFVERGSHQTYHPGRELQRIAALVTSRFDIGQLAVPLLKNLVDRFPETAVLCLYNTATHRGTIAEVVLTPHPLRFNVERGGEVSLPWGSLGQAILAHLPEEEREKVLGSEHIGPLTGLPMPTRPELEATFSHVREHGYAHYCQDRYDLAGYASPVFNGTGAILGSIGMVMPLSRHDRYGEQELASALREAAASFTEQAAHYT